MHAPQHFVFLDGLRGVAALGVLWHHILLEAKLPTSENIAVAVDFFFMLSGFVIAHAYGAPMRRGISLASFAWSRVCRLYPMMVFGAALGSALLVLHVIVLEDIAWWRVHATIALGLFGLPSYLIPIWSTAFPINGPQWSLFFEIVINVVYVAVGRFLTPARLAALTLVAAVCLVLATLTLGTVGYGFEKGTVVWGLARITFGFFAGMLIYHVPRVGRAGWPAAAILTAGFAGLIVSPWSAPPLALTAIIIGGFPIFIWGASMIHLPADLTGFCKGLGAISYPLYLIHHPVLRVTSELAERMSPTGPFLWMFLAAEFGLVLGLSWLVLRFFEDPARAWLRSVGRRPTRA